MLRAIGLRLRSLAPSRRAGERERLSNRDVLTGSGSSSKRDRLRGSAFAMAGCCVVLLCSASRRCCNAVQADGRAVEAQSADEERKVCKTECVEALSLQKLHLSQSSAGGKPS